MQGDSIFIILLFQDVLCAGYCTINVHAKILCRSYERIMGCGDETWFYAFGSAYIDHVIQFLKGYTNISGELFSSENQVMKICNRHHDNTYRNNSTFKLYI